MREAYVAELLEDVALELFVIDKVAPLLRMDTAPESTYNPRTDRMDVTLAVSSLIGGMSLPQAVEKLGVRPLAFGAAWKVLDLLLEYALDEAGERSRHRSRWTIEEKTAHARSGAGQAAPLTDHPGLWRHLLVSYASTEQVRHSLVHRRATVGPDGAVTGADRSGASLPAVTSGEQMYFMRAVQRTMKYLQQDALGDRDEAALLGELDQLSRLTGLPSTGHRVVEHPPVPTRVKVGNGQQLDLTRMKSRMRGTTPTAAEFDVIFEVDGRVYRVPLEDVPDGVVIFRESLAWLA